MLMKAVTSEGPSAAGIRSPRLGRRASRGGLRAVGFVGPSRGPAAPVATIVRDELQHVEEAIPGGSRLLIRARESRIPRRVAQPVLAGQIDDGATRAGDDLHRVHVAGPNH